MTTVESRWRGAPARLSAALLGSLLLHLGAGALPLPSSPPTGIPIPGSALRVAVTRPAPVPARTPRSGTTPAATVHPVAQPAPERPAVAPAAVPPARTVSPPPRPQRQARTTTAARPTQPESRAQLPPSGAHGISLDDRAGMPPSPVDSALDGTDNGRPPDTDPNLQARQRLLAWLEHELGRYFSYPRRAWRRGWEGTVRLAFEVEPGSGITNIRIAASSGHALLDSDARDTLRRIAEMGVPPLPSHGGRIALSLPVVYQRY
ncbi:MAG: TonB family protein [Candidatus Sedimenticola endophacoides]